MKSGNAHIPVLLGPVLTGLDIKEDGCYVDGTFGRGGHSGAILAKLGPNGRLIGIDRDPQAIAAAPAALARDPRVELIRGSCAELETFIAERKLVGNVDGCLFDLGVSSPQLDEAHRGFSFLRDGPLDMRMDPDTGLSASEWLHVVDEKTLRQVIGKFGEERYAPRIARAIVAAKGSAALTTTLGLANLVESVTPKIRNRSGQLSRKHPATKTFQAIRIFINGELEQLEALLAQSVNVLKQGGRLCVISFHSLEDRMTKRFIRDNSREPEQYRGMPTIPPEFRPRIRAVGRAIAASNDEIAANRRARSAHLRIAERT